MPRAHDEAAEPPFPPEIDFATTGDIVGNTDWTPRWALAVPSRFRVGLDAGQTLTLKAVTWFACGITKSCLKAGNGLIIDVLFHARADVLVREPRHQIRGGKIVSRSYSGDPGRKRFIGVHRWGERKA